MNGYQAANVLLSFLRYMKSTSVLHEDEIDIPPEPAFKVLSTINRTKLKLFACCIRNLSDLLGCLTERETSEIFVLIFHILAKRGLPRTAGPPTTSLSIFQAMSQEKGFGQCLHRWTRSKTDTEILIVSISR